MIKINLPVDKSYIKTRWPFAGLNRFRLNQTYHCMCYLYTYTKMLFVMYRSVCECVHTQHTYIEIIIARYLLHIWRFVTATTHDQIPLNFHHYCLLYSVLIDSRIQMFIKNFFFNFVSSEYLLRVIIILWVLVRIFLDRIL